MAATADGHFCLASPPTAARLAGWGWMTPVDLAHVGAMDRVSGIGIGQWPHGGRLTSSSSGSFSICSMRWKYAKFS